MKTHLTTLTLFLFILNTCAQNQSDTLFYNVEKDSVSEQILKEYDFLKNVPPLELIFSYAQEHSPIIKMQDALTRKIDFDVQRVKKSWLDMLLFNSTAQYGSFGNETLDQLNLGYTVGGSIRFSVYDVMSIRDQVGVYAQEKIISQYKTDILLDELKNRTILYYNAVKLKQQLVNIKSEARQAAYVHVKMAEQEFLSGEIPVSELARVTEIYANAEAALIVTITEFKDAYMLLQELVGVDLKSIKG